MTNSLPAGKAERFFTAEELEALQHPGPRHVAIIMDGNRRWARGHETETKEGHHRGADRLMDIVKAGKELGIQVLTVYAFSTENWNRTEAEVTLLFQLIEDYLRREHQAMAENGIRLESIGDIAGLPASLQEMLTKAKETTADCNQITLVLSLNYGSRDEICRAMKRMMEAHDRGELPIDAIDEKTVSQYLDTAPYPDPDILIRTSGEMRVSNFLLWQISYTELYVTDTLWPDFTPKRLLEALLTFQERERRRGS